MTDESRKVRPSAGNRGLGRKKGVPNKLTKTIKEAIEISFSEVGGAKYLEEMAIKQPVAYMTLLGKVLPTQVTGENGGPVQLQTIKREFVRPKD